MPQAFLSRLSILTNMILSHRDMKIQLEDSKAGERLRQGIQIAIVGAPNVGKSTLLNSLIQRPAAIVSPIPGIVFPMLSFCKHLSLVVNN